MEAKDLFLGGTCNGSKWRDKLIPLLNVSYFNPVVEDWTPECQKEEIRQRENAKFVLYTITPKMTGFYSIAEVVDDSNKRPEKTLYCLLTEDADLEFTNHQLKSFIAMNNMLINNGAKVFNSLEEVADYVNNN